MTKKSNSILARVRSVVSSLTQPEGGDLVSAILMDHQDLKSLIKILKDPEESVAKKKVALKRFSSLLKSHSQAEEKALYSFSLHLRGLELKTDEGFVEHDVSSALLARIKPPRAGMENVRRWKSQLQVLGELVEHHLKEEERDLLPQVRKKLDPQSNATRYKLFIRLRRSSQKSVSSENSGALRLET